MARYKLINRSGWASWHIGFEIDDEVYLNGVEPSTAKAHIKNFPNDWEIIKEEPMCTEKTIKLSLDQAKKMYGKSPEMDELLLANFSKNELTKRELPKSILEILKWKGFIINSATGNIESSNSQVVQRTYFTEPQAKSARAMAQLSHLMAVYNDEWKPDFTSYYNKYVIYGFANLVKAGFSTSNHHFLAFKSAEIRDEFLKNFEPLIKEYFMID